ncbi:hypothetical protein BDQ17DRAFT_1414003 [Cyathus striatus]|nr:hypothetical protein BDQ17DRAFT_1414003 [Cyathus striatus]
MQYERASVDDLSNILSMKSYLISTSTLLIYDFILTFHAEVSQFLVFCWNMDGRRYNPSNCSAYDHTSLPPGLIICKRFSVVELLHVFTISTLAEMLLCVRIHALTMKDKFVSALFGILVLAQMILALCITLSGTREMVAQTSVMLNKASETALDIRSFQICVFIPTSNVTRLILAYLALALTFEIFAIIAIFYFTGSTCDRILPLSPWIRVVRKGGMIYFVIKVISTLILIIIILKAPDTIKLITIVPHSIISAILINHIFLSLRKALKQPYATSTALTEYVDNSFHFIEERYTERSTD